MKKIFLWKEGNGFNNYIKELSCKDFVEDVNEILEAQDVYNEMMIELSHGEFVEHCKRNTLRYRSFLKEKDLGLNLEDLQENLGSANLDGYEC